MTANNELADFSCSSCGNSRMALVNGTNGLYECERCSHRTHDKIEQKREELENTDTGLPIDDIADVWVGGGDDE